MTKSLDIVIIYQELGKVLRDAGASRIYLLSSKTINDVDKMRLEIEIVADHLEDQTAVSGLIRAEFPDIICSLYDASSEEGYELLREAEADGIQL